MKTRPTRLRRSDVFRETERAWAFRVAKDSGDQVTVYVPKSQSEWSGTELRIAPWLGHAVFKEQGVTI